MWKTPLLLVSLAVCVSSLSSQSQDKRQVHGGQATTSAPSGQDPTTEWLQHARTNKPNVLFIIVDDLRPKLGCYGDDNMITPNIDHLASLGVRFNRAYVQVALCGPSRASFLTGRRADTTHVFDLTHYWRTVGGNFTTMPQYFKQHGFASHGIGKVFHPGSSSGNNDIHYSWSDDYDSGHQTLHVTGNNVMHPVNETGGKLQDTAIADGAIQWMKTHTSHGNQPFFLAVGFHKPHMPWIYPQQYNALYPLTHIHLAQHRHKPSNVPDDAFYECSNLKGSPDIKSLNLQPPEYYIPDNTQLKIRQAYSAAVSYIDAQVGRVLEAVGSLGLAQNTIISFIGDHGWQLGENGQWCKQNNFEMAVRIPMILYVPGVTARGHGFHFLDAFDTHVQNTSFAGGPYHATDELVEAVDLFATMAELAGLPVPRTCPVDASHVEECTEGTSLVPLVRAVRAASHGTNYTVTWKDAVYSQYGRGLAGSHHPVMGYTVRTDRYRYTEWVEYDAHQYEAHFSTSYGNELYDHTVDPQEANNLANDTAHRDTVLQLSQKLHAGWRQTLQTYTAGK